MGALNVKTVSFANAATSGEIDLGAESIMSLLVPASFGLAAITFQASLTKGGTFYAVYASTGAAITVTVSATAAGIYDLTSIFPAGVRYIKLAVASAITKDVQIISKGV
jgi:hypothetical protein